MTLALLNSKPKTTDGVLLMLKLWYTIRYDTIRDAILTCARKPTWVGLIYRTETTTKNCKTEKLKSKSRYVRSNSKSLGNRVVSSEEEKRKAAVGRICRKRRAGVVEFSYIHTRRACVHQAAKLVAALLRVARVTVGLAESNGSLPPGLWLTSSAGWLPRTGISSGPTLGNRVWATCLSM